MKCAIEIKTNLLWDQNTTFSNKKTEKKGNADQFMISSRE